MTVTLSPEAERIVEERLHSGKFGSPEEVVEEALKEVRKDWLPEWTPEQGDEQRHTIERIREFSRTNKISFGEGRLRDLMHEDHRY